MKTPLFALFLFAACIACAAPGVAAAAPASCCPEDVGSAGYSDRSLYQLDAVFQDDAGQAVRLGAFLGQPVVLTMFFTHCNYACPMLISDMTRVRDMLPPQLRTQARLVLVSFDVARDPPAVLQAYRESRGLDAGWTLLHGGDSAIKELAALLGVKFKLDADGQFSHSNLITLLNAKGEIVHQRTGLQGGLEETAAALEAAITSK